MCKWGGQCCDWKIFRRCFHEDPALEESVSIALGWQLSSKKVGALRPRDVRTLQKAPTADRIAAIWYAESSFDIDINLTDGQAHQVKA